MSKRTYHGNNLILTPAIARQWRDNPSQIAYSIHKKYLDEWNPNADWQFEVKYPFLEIHSDQLDTKIVYDIMKQRVTFKTINEQYSTHEYPCTFSTLVHHAKFFQYEGKYSELGGKFDVTIYTDASFIYQFNAIGYAAWCKGTDYTKKFVGKQIPDYKSSSNLAEMIPIILAVKTVIKERPEFQHLLINTDCQSIIPILKYGTISPESKQYEQYIKTHDYFINMIQGKRITFRHVKGHNGTDNRRSWLNTWCDTQAGEQSKEAIKLRQRKRNAN